MLSKSFPLGPQCYLPLCFIVLFLTAVTSAKLHGLAKFDEIRKNRFHMLTNDEELAEEEDQRLKDEAKEVARQNRRFREVRSNVSSNRSFNFGQELTTDIFIRLHL